MTNAGAAMTPDTLYRLSPPLIALQFIAFGWRVNREISLGDAARGTLVLIPDVLNIMSLFATVAGIEFCPILEVLPSVCRPHSSFKFLAYDRPCGRLSPAGKTGHVCMVLFFLVSSLQLPQSVLPDQFEHQLEPPWGVCLTLAARDLSEGTVVHPGVRRVELGMI
jgi:hypothetical protein